VLLFVASGTALASGTVSAFGPLWMARLFGLLLWWLGPLAIHFHFYLITPTPTPHRYRLVIVLYILAALASLPDLIVNPMVLYSAAPQLAAARQVWLAANLLGVVLLLVWAHRRSASREIPHRINLIALGSGMALMPFCTLFLLPYTLLHQWILPPEAAFLLLLAIPLTYGYVVCKYPIFELDHYISRVAAYALVVAVLGGLYLSLSAVLARRLPSDLRWLPVTNIALGLLCAMTISPLYGRLQIVVNHLLYGSWYDYRSAVKHLSQALAQATDRLTLAQTLSQCLQKTLQLKCASLLLSDQTGALTIVEMTSGSCFDAKFSSLCLDTRSPIHQYFQHQPYVIAGAELRKMLESASLTEAEQQLLLSDQARLWIPLFSSGRLHGLCVLGPKHNAKNFDASDVDMLQVVARLASSYFQNSQLISELQQRAKEIEQMHQQIIHAREEERKRVARELHDQIIQELVGLNFNLSKMRDDPDLDLNDQIPQLQRDTRQILGEVRRICSDLRPPALDSLGLVAAVRSRVRELERQDSLQVVLRIEGNVERRLPEDVSLCVFRVLQEALSNAHKHACAGRVEVSLLLHAEELCLVVKDDGKGFQVPQNLGQLLEGKHFGLVGLRERLDLVHGSLEVISRPGHGTCLRAWVPLSLPDPPLALCQGSWELYSSGKKGV
jgi:signal transduction histidine kinase